MIRLALIIPAMFFFVTLACPPLARAEQSKIIANCISEVLNLRVYADGAEPNRGWIEVENRADPLAAEIYPVQLEQSATQVRVSPTGGLESFSVSRGVNRLVSLRQKRRSTGPAILQCLTRTVDEHYLEEDFAESDSPPVEKIIRDADGSASDGLQRLGFNCSADKTELGAVQVCIGSIPEYPRQIAVLIPPGYQQQQHPGLLLYLMGANTPAWIETLEFTRWFGPRTLRYKLNETHFRLTEQFAAAQRGAIMVVPHSQMDCTDYEQNLTGPAGFDGFVRATGRLFEAAGLWRGDQPERLALIAQSGAYRAAASILGNTASKFSRRINEVYLFDAVFGRMDQFAAWIQKNPQKRFWSGYVDGWTDVGNQRIIQQLDTAGIKYYLQPDGAMLFDQDLKAKNIGFFKADPAQTHLTILGRYFGKIVGSGSFAGTIAQERR